MNIPAVSQTKPICIVVSKKLFFFKKKKIRTQYWLWHPCCFFELHQKIKQKNTLNVVNITDTILVQIKMWNVYRRRRVRTHSNGNNSHDSLSKVSLKVLCFVHDFTHKNYTLKYFVYMKMKYKYGNVKRHGTDIYKTVYTS